MRDPRDWTEAERLIVLDFHATFSTPEGRRVLEVLRRDLWDRLSAIDEAGNLLDRESTLLREGERSAFRRITGYLDAYDAMVSADNSPTRT